MSSFILFYYYHDHLFSLSLAHQSQRVCVCVPVHPTTSFPAAVLICPLIIFLVFLCSLWLSVFHVSKVSLKSSSRSVSTNMLRLYHISFLFIYLFPYLYLFTHLFLFFIVFLYFAIARLIIINSSATATFFLLSLANHFFLVSLSTIMLDSTTCCFSVTVFLCIQQRLS